MCEEDANLGPQIFAVAHQPCALGHWQQRLEHARFVGKRLSIRSFLGRYQMNSYQRFLDMSFGHIFYIWMCPVWPVF